jgi:predicted transcriptional regulator
MAIMNTHANDPHLTTKIVSKYVGHHKLATGQLSDLITTIHQAIGRLGQPDEEEKAQTPAVSIRRSVQQSYVVCLDCGFRAVTLRRHIRVHHGLTPDEYRHRWGLKNNHPLTAPIYSERRSALAKKLGLGRKAPMPIAAEPEMRQTPEPKSKTRRSTRPSDVAAETPSEAIPPKGRRTRSRARAATQL